VQFLSPISVSDAFLIERPSKIIAKLDCDFAVRFIIRGKANQATKSDSGNARVNKPYKIIA